MFKIFRADPLAWTFFLGIIAMILLSAGFVYADAAGLEKMNKQMISVSAQLNGNCSSTLIYSKRDDKSGEVQTVLLTAKHCVSDQQSDMKVDLPVYQQSRMVKRDQYIARVMGQWYKGDLALVELKDKQTLFENVAKLGPEKPFLTMGEDVWTVGYPLGWSLTITRGLFGAMETQDFDKPGTEYFRATPDITGGNSGGALYRMNGAGDYELIGVTAAGVPGRPFVGIYTNINDIHEYLKIALPQAVAKK